MHVEVERGGKLHTGIQWRHRNSMSPVVHLVFTHPQCRCCALRAQAVSFERPVKARGQRTPEAVVLDATLEMESTPGVGTRIVIARWK